MGEIPMKVVGVTLEHEALSRCPLGKLESACTKRMVTEIGTKFVDHLLGHRRPEVHGEHVEKGR
jgi:hypothetical protein